MNNTTVVLAAVIFALVGTLVFAAIAPYLATDANAATKSCPRLSPDGQDGPLNDGLKKGCGPNMKRAVPG